MKLRDRIKELRRVPASELLPNPKNWRTHPAEQADAMRGVLAEVGIADAVLARETEHGLMLIDGHLRADVAPGSIWPVLVLDVTEEEADKLLATLDPLAGMAEVDEAKLGKLLASIDTESEALQGLLDEMKPVEDVELIDEPAQTDQAAELQKQWGTEAGQLWLVKGKQEHRLKCGDSTVEGDVSQLLDGEAPWLMVTDPPYGVNYDPNWRNEAAAAGHLNYAARRVGTVENDDRVDWSDAYKLFPGDVAYTWSPPGDHIILTGQALQGAGFQIRNQIIWRKPHFPISRGHYTYRHEPCWYGVKKGSKAHWIGDATSSTMWEVSLDKNVDGGHSTQKPLECMARPIRNHEGDVYDPFLGSGTTMVAAEQLGRRCYGMEISPGYVAVALERMTKLGCKCELESETLDIRKHCEAGGLAGPVAKVVA